MQNIFNKVKKDTLTSIVMVCLLGLGFLIFACSGTEDTDDNTNVNNDDKKADLLPFERISIDDSGVQGNNYSYRATISGDGRLIAFYSAATNLVADDTNTANDIFLFDRQTKKMKKISLAENGSNPNGNSMQPVISANGRFVTYQSTARNLVTGDTNGRADIFVYNIEANKTERVSVDAAGVQSNNNSSSPVISADGRFIAFESLANNLVPNDNNSAQDIFVYDRQTAAIEKASVGYNGTPAGEPPATNSNNYAPAISGDGRYVAFHSLATNLIAEDNNSASDVFVYDRQTKTTEQISIGVGGAGGNANSLMATISADGRFVAYESFATNIVPGDTNNVADIFVYDRQTKTTKRVSINDRGSQSNGHTNMAYICANGRYVAYQSHATKLISGDTNKILDIFIYDRQTDTVKRISLGVQGEQGNQESTDAAISADGNYLVFQSLANNFVPGDTNNVFDIFVAPIK